MKDKQGRAGQGEERGRLKRVRHSTVQYSTALDRRAKEEVVLCGHTIILDSCDVEAGPFLACIMDNVRTVVVCKVERDSFAIVLTLELHGLDGYVWGILEEIFEDGEIGALCVDLEHANGANISVPKKVAKPACADVFGGPIAGVDASLQTRAVVDGARTSGADGGAEAGGVVERVAVVERAASGLIAVDVEGDGGGDVGDEVRVDLERGGAMRAVGRVEGDEQRGALADGAAVGADVDVDRGRAAARREREDEGHGCEEGQQQEEGGEEREEAIWEATRAREHCCRRGWWKAGGGRREAGGEGKGKRGDAMRAAGRKRGAEGG